MARALHSRPCTYLDEGVHRSRDHVTITQSRMMFAGVIVLLFSRIASAQSQSNAQLSPADLVKAVIRSALNTSAVTEIRRKYLLVKEVDGKAATSAVVDTEA